MKFIEMSNSYLIDKHKTELIKTHLTALKGRWRLNPEIYKLGELNHF